MSIKFVAGEKNEPFFVLLVLKLGKEPKSVWDFTLPSFWRKIYLQEWKSPMAGCNAMNTSGQKVPLDVSLWHLLESAVVSGR